MARKPKAPDEIVFCRCPNCGVLRTRENGSFTIIRKGYEHGKKMRFYCLKCKTWFNESAGKVMFWADRDKIRFK